VLAFIQQLLHDSNVTIPSASIGGIQLNFFWFLTWGISAVNTIISNRRRPTVKQLRVYWKELQQLMLMNAAHQKEINFMWQWDVFLMIQMKKYCWTTFLGMHYSTHQDLQKSNNIWSRIEIYYEDQKILLNNIFNDVKGTSWSSKELTKWIIIWHFNWHCAKIFLELYCDEKIKYCSTIFLKMWCIHDDYLHVPRHWQDRAELFIWV